MSFDHCPEEPFFTVWPEPEGIESWDGHPCAWIQRLPGIWVPRLFPGMASGNDFHWRARGHLKGELEGLGYTLDRTLRREAHTLLKGRWVWHFLADQLSAQYRGIERTVFLVTAYPVEADPLERLAQIKT